jgi:hypothetical protein
MGEQEEHRNERNVMVNRKGGLGCLLTCWLRPQIMVDYVFLIMRRTLYIEQLNQSDFISGCFYSQKPQEALNLISYRGLLLYTCIHVYTQFAECTSTECK